MKRSELSFKKPSDRILIPLDVDEISKALRIVEQLRGLVGGFKVGLQLMHVIFWSLLAEPNSTKAATNLRDVRELFEMILSALFWDAKFNDIPNTVGGASRETARMGVKMFDVHASAGIPAMQAAAAVKEDALLLAITVLTSLSDEECKSIFGNMPDGKVLQFAQDAFAAGANGIVCSPKELQLIRNVNELDELITVIPGIRPTYAKKDDQQRITTPGMAIKDGADFLVIGRAITAPPANIGGSVEAVKIITDEIGEAEAEMAGAYRV